MIAANEISANELRIGNWVNDLPIEKGGGGNGYMQVDGMVLSDIGMFDLRPIPLTPEVLEACNLNNSRLIFKFECDDEITVEHSMNPESSLTFPCKSLHQLQNLYFALTGTELPVFIDVLKSVDTL